MLNKKSLDRLKATWRKKLSKSGFKDLEDADGNLIEHQSAKFVGRDLTTFKAQERYYQLADQLLNDFQFKSIEDRTIWRLHCQGKTIAQIAHKLGRSETFVRNFIEELAKEFK